MVKDEKAENSDLPEDNDNWWKVFAVLAVGVLVVEVVSGFVISWWAGEDGRGTIGDMFGVTNALFSGLAFAGLVVTMLMQRKELQLQRGELKLQRKEIKLNRIEFEKTAEAQKEMVEVAKLENSDRRAREHRAATLLLRNMKMHERAKENSDGTLTRLFKAHNLGPNVTDLSIPAIDTKHVELVCFSPTVVLAHDDLFTIELAEEDPARPWIREEITPKFKFALQYTDSNGNIRRQEYELCFDSQMIECVNLGMSFEEEQLLGL